MPLPGQMTQLVGPAGLNVTPSDPGQSPSLENVVMDSDGTWRPRYGLRLVHKFIDSNITMMCPWLWKLNASMSLSLAVMGNVPDGFSSYSHRLYHLTSTAIITNSIGGTSGTIIGIGNPGLDLSSVYVGSLQKSRWPTARTVGVVSDADKESKVLFSYLADVTFDQTIQSYDTDSFGISDPSLITISGLIVVRGWVWNHSYHVVSLGDREARWSAYSNVNSWPVANYKIMPGDLGKPLVGLPLGVNTSYIFCENGVMQLYGEIDTKFRWARTDLPTCVSPHGCAVSTGDKIFYLSPGPKISVIGGDQGSRADVPVSKDLRGIEESNDIRAFYDPLHDAYCLSGPFNGVNTTYLLSNEDQKWIGKFFFADNSYVPEHCATVGPRRDRVEYTILNSEPPFSLTCVALNSSTHSLLSYWDPTLFADETDVATSTAFTCAIETAPNVGDDIYFDKLLSDVYVECSGTWTVKLLYRNDPNAAWTSATIGTVSDSSPWLHPSVSTAPVYKERKLRIEAPSASGLRIRRVSINERTLGVTR